MSSGSQLGPMTTGNGPGAFIGFLVGVKSNRLPLKFSDVSVIQMFFKII